MTIVQRILFIPHHYTDYRMWTGIPDLIQDRAEVTHFDQHERVPWPDPDAGFIAAVRRLSGDRPFDIVTAAGEAARFAFAVAENGLARGVVFLDPALDRHPDDAPDVDLTEVLAPYLSVIPVLLEGDADQLRDALMQVARDTAGPDAAASELQLFADIFTDHAGELFSDIKAIQAEAATGVQQPTPPWLDPPWIDRVGSLTIPVTAVIPPKGAAVGETITRRARQAELVTVSPGLVSVADPGQFAAVLLRMLDRVE